METSVVTPVPEKEFERIIDLSELDLDYTDLHLQLKDLAKLAAKIAGSEICLINLIDSFTQWTISAYGLNINQMPREEGICQYTILEDSSFEVRDLSKDDRFKSRNYVASHPHLKYYFGLPLISKNGYKIGTLCVLDVNHKELGPEKAELLKMISIEIVERLQIRKEIRNLQNKLVAEHDLKRQLNHDLRGPIGGIIGLIQLIKDQDGEEKVSDIFRYLDLVEKAGNNLLEIANEKLASKKQKGQRELRDHELNLVSLKDKLEELYKPQAQAKKIDLTIANDSQCEELPFPKEQVLQLAGNLLSNTIHFTLEGEMVMVRLEYKCASKSNCLLVTIKNTGSKLTNNQIKKIFSDDPVSQTKVMDVNLQAIYFLLEKAGGSFSISDEGNRGNRFDLELPIKRTKK